MAAETAEVHKHRSRTRVEKSEHRSLEEDEGRMEESTEERCKNTEKGMMLGSSKEAYNSLKALTKTQQPKSAVIEHSSGNILTENIIIIIYPLTAKVVGAPQMILQPVFSIFPCSPLPFETCRTPGLSIP